MSSEAGDGMEPEDENMSMNEETMQPAEDMPMTEASEAEGMAPAAAPQAEGRRTQLKIVRENIDYLSRQIGKFKKSHEESSRKLEGQVASLRKELAAHARSINLSAHDKVHTEGHKRLEKQIASLKSDMAALKTQMAKDAAKSRAKEEAALSKILAKVRTTGTSKKSASKPSKKKR